MVRSSYLGELLSTILDRPRTLWRGTKSGAVAELCEELLNERTEVSSIQIASEILARFSVMDSAERNSFFHHLNDALDVDASEIAAKATQYASTPSTENYRQLAQTSEPRRYEFLRRLNQPPGATGQIVRMRTALLAQIKEDPELARSDVDFALMLRAWFNRGFLVLRQITWDSPASVLEKLIEYEAVHEIKTWDELRRRLHPSDRRCFAFFHPAMPDEPLIFVEIALSKGVPVSIQDVLADDRKTLDEAKADTAVFYSISNCQKGLAGISFGNSLIKQVVRDLALDLPWVKNFVTLSPIPGFARWLDTNGATAAKTDGDDLRKLAAYYLVHAKTERSDPADPVARFHLSNGAQIHALHSDADLSKKGQIQSSGLMVNYAYQLDKITDNLELLGRTGQVAASSSVKTLARQGALVFGKKQGLQIASRPAPKKPSNI